MIMTRENEILQYLHYNPGASIREYADAVLELPALTTVRWTMSSRYVRHWRTAAAL